MEMSAVLKYLRIFVCLIPMIVGAILFFLNPNDYYHRIIVLYLLLATFVLLWFLLCYYNIIAAIWTMIIFVFSFPLPFYIWLMVNAYSEYNDIPIGIQQSALTQFNISSIESTPTISYNFTLHFKVGPNRKNVAVLFDQLQIGAAYQGNTFGSISLPPFFLARKNNHSFNSSTVLLRGDFHGQREIFFPGYENDIYALDEAARRFTISVTFGMKGVRTKDDYMKRNVSDVRARGSVKKDMTFQLKEVPLSNTTSGWVKGGWKAYNSKVGWYTVGMIVFAIFTCCLLPQGKPVLHCTVLCVAVSVVFMVLLALTLWSTDKVDIRVSDVALSEFDLSPSSGALRYNLSVVVTIGPNRQETGLYFKDLRMGLSYSGKNFANFSFAPSYLQVLKSRGGRTLVFHPRIEGNGEVALTKADIEKYKRQNAKKKYSIAAMVSYEGIRTNSYNLAVKSNLVKGRIVKGTAHFKLKLPLLI